MIIMLLPPNQVFILYTLTSITSPFLISLLPLYPKILGMDVLILKSPHHNSLPHIMGFDIKIIPKEFKLHACTCHYHHYNQCHYCTSGFVLFHNVTYYINSLLSHIHVNTTYLLHIICTLVAMRGILGKVEYTCSTPLNCDMT